ncbi:hypothetical protein SAMN04488066_106123 [Halorubrum aquaticum]|uniref:Uncharacterized protein n=1 Tax=Halorubrum aquaticum TaxID=387340 RepID=A0A1I3ALW0_9EURY|nr:hypothetical protein SAMN04488066_106123 [Halorubrum aquaticum]
MTGEYALRGEASLGNAASAAFPRSLTEPVTAKSATIVKCANSTAWTEQDLIRQLLLTAGRMSTLATPCFEPWISSLFCGLVIWDNPCLIRPSKTYQKTAQRILLSWISTGSRLKTASLSSGRAPRTSTASFLRLSSGFRCHSSLLASQSLLRPTFSTPIRTTWSPIAASTANVGYSHVTSNRLGSTKSKTSRTHSRRSVRTLDTAPLTSVQPADLGSNFSFGVSLPRQQFRN